MRMAFPTIKISYYQPNSTDAWQSLASSDPVVKMQYLIYTINLTSNRDKQLREHIKNQGAIHKHLRALKFRSFK